MKESCNLLVFADTLNVPCYTFICIFGWENTLAEFMVIIFFNGMWDVRMYLSCMVLKKYELIKLCSLKTQGKEISVWMMIMLKNRLIFKVIIYRIML